MIPSAVLFDCDGVIVDSEGPTFLMLQADFAVHGLSLTLHELETNWIGATAEDLHLRARSEGATLPDDWVADFYIRLNRRLAEGVPLIPGILPVLDVLDRAGIPYAVCSNGTLPKMQITLGQHGLLPRLNGHTYSGQALGRPKPAPDVYLHASRALAVAPETTVVIEDSPTGARAARAAGIRCLGYAPLGSHPGLVAEGATLFHRMNDLPAMIGL
ncbi:HAD family hydrolase [Tabrizicola sp. BL-A-41-H6]|uniref:HAD family hydrolase n=1 Tax=Tabrizicola sp. BL-A-41-H6 TaxID=3421107 RepID=UPI003D674232